MTNEILEINCNNCKNFIKYYIKTNSGFKSLVCGKCFIKRKRTLTYANEVCASWQAAEPYPTDEKTQALLKSIYEKLEQVVELLKDDI